jgi:Cu2+-exporting ATPase
MTAVCCPTDAALDAASVGSVAGGEFDLATREIAPGLGLLQVVAPAMHCGACISAIERGLKRQPGVRDARANLTARRVSVEFALAETSGEAVAAALGRLGYESHPLDDGDAADAAEARETRDLLTRLGVAGFASMNIMLLSISVWAGAEGATRDLMHWISGLIALPTVAYAGRPFFASALAGIRAGRLNMDCPISIALVFACVISLSETLRGGAEAYFDAAATLCFLLLVGRYLDRLMRSRARSAAGRLARLQPRGATVLTADGPAYRPLTEIAPGDLVRVAPGERIAVDGVVVEGASDVDVSHLTGEAAPEPLAEGGRAQAGALNLSGALTLRTTAVGVDSTLGEIQRLMAAAEERKSDVARLADRAGAIYAPLAHVVGLATLLGWMALGASFRDAAFHAVALLIITCPCALGIAAPMAQATAAGALFRRGIMLKDGAALERLALVDRVVFDKTGTLTEGRPAMRAPSPAVPRATLAAGAAVAGGSRHPLAAAFAAWAAQAGLGGATARAVVERPGLGVEGEVDGRPVRLGRAAFAGAPDDAAADATATWLKVGDAAPVALVFDDSPRAGAAETVAALRAAGVAVEALSGDRPGPVAALCRRLGIDDWRAGATPQDKIDRLRAIADGGGRALMVGDGVNDAPALAAASVSMAPSSAADVGRAAADLVFFGEDLRAAADARALAVRTRRVILQNFAIAAVYNLIAIPVAATGHASPLVAAVAMSSSSLVVTLNALRLQRIPTAAPAARPAAAPALRERAA